MVPRFHLSQLPIVALAIALMALTLNRNAKAGEDPAEEIRRKNSRTMDLYRSAYPVNLPEPQNPVILSKYLNRIVNIVGELKKFGTDRWNPGEHSNTGRLDHMVSAQALADSCD